MPLHYPVEYRKPPSNPTNISLYETRHLHGLDHRRLAARVAVAAPELPLAVAAKGDHLATVSSLNSWMHYSFLYY